MPESESNIIEDDLFEGWMSMPSMKNLFEANIWETSEHRSESSKLQKKQQVATFNPTCRDLDTNREGQLHLCEIPSTTSVDINNFQDLLKHLKTPLPTVQSHASEGDTKSHA